MFEDFEKYLKKRKRQKMLKKAKRYIELGLIILLPVTILIVLHILKKKAKKKVKQAIKTKVKENISAKRDADAANETEKDQ